MKRITFFWCLVLFPFAFMILINETHEVPTTDYDKNKCTRYCHSKGCFHTYKKYFNSSAYFIAPAMEAYLSMIHWLGNSGTGLGYKTMNIVLYVVFFPFGMTILLWGIIRKS